MERVELPYMYVHLAVQTCGVLLYPSTIMLVRFDSLPTPELSEASRKHIRSVRV